jgi:hypothetical protein
MTETPSEYEMALAGLEGLETKGMELAHRAKILRQAIRSGEVKSLEFFILMALESAKAAEFWASLLEKHRAALIAGQTGASGK